MSITAGWMSMAPGVYVSKHICALSAKSILKKTRCLNISGIANTLIHLPHEAPHTRGHGDASDSPNFESRQTDKT
jgi:hypothetical protein